MEYSVLSYTTKSKLHTNNEDSLFICDDYIIVADGMGGECDGDIASRIAVETIDSFLAPYIPKVNSEKEIKILLSQAIYKADSQILDYIEDNPDSFGMGTTVMLAIRKGDMLYISWCGDSRCYTYKNGKIRSITKDHSYVQQLIDSGHISVEESFTHPYNNLVTRYVGGGKETCVPDYCTYHISGSELIIFCSDGLSGYCKNTDIEKELKYIKNFDTLPKRLSDLAKRHESDDDITIVTLIPKTYSKSCPSNLIFNWLKKISYIR